uniref:Uncharacterized protein n=1 Tax=viral metagenome TaxID=1070528 RepID=A0A6M3IS62_9ZZZZ
MATIDQVIEAMIEFRDTVYEKLDNLQNALDTLDLNQYVNCTMCHGAKTVIPSYDEGSPTPDPIQCPSCLGMGKLLHGTIEESGEV